MDTVEELAVKPFREVVEKGKMAMQNAGESQDMMKEAQRLVKVGERGLTRIESSCRKLYDEYGVNFIRSLKENEEITEYRKQLTNLLWDFDDFIDADTFETEKFQELQILSREAAPKVYNILITMKLEVLAHSFSHLSPPSSPVPHSPSLASEPSSQHPFGLMSSTRGSTSGSQGDSRSVADCPHMEDATARLRNLMLSGLQSQVPDEDFVIEGAAGSRIRQPSASPVRQPPRPPSLDPWDPKLAPSCQGTDMSAYSSVAVNRRPNFYPPESPVDPAISPMSAALRRRLSTQANNLHKGVVGVCDQYTDEYSDYRISDSSSQSHVTNATSQGTHSRTPPTESLTIPEEVMSPQRMGNSAYSIQQLHVRAPLYPPPPKSLGGFATGGVEDMDRQYQAVRQLQANPRTSPLAAPAVPPKSTSSFERHTGYNGNNTLFQSLKSPSGISTPTGQAGLEVAVSVPLEDPDHGLILVDSEEPSNEMPARMPPRNCNIGPNSTFCLYKGFCQGALEVVRGGIGVKKTKKPGFSGAATVARCTGCLYELDFFQIECDINKEDKGNFHKSGINYRLRFLQKSHLPAKRIDDVLYACMFCVRLGRTIDECDATVFTTSKALFNHLTRHPRPLPQISGVAVVEGDSMPAHLRNDYDIQFLRPPEAHVPQLNRSQIYGRATGVAQDQSRKLFGQRLLFDRSPALELCHGAKVVGIEWPEKYNGEWIFAWHDGVHASAPADIIKLDTPPSEDIMMFGASLIRAKTRWKFHQKEKDKDQSLWLKFDKNEAITNISYVDPEFWCWSGTNSKGKRGIFPKDFLEPSTIQTLTSEGADRAMTLSNEKNKSSSMLGKFSSRRRSIARSPSIAESSSSHETFSSYTLAHSRSNK
ncbi:hypothetical protein E4U59_005997 [Claviceps monticola]|nr:hypothetical protein E4U59_005997 [Claviceps monticola]